MSDPTSDVPDLDGSDDEALPVDRPWWAPLTLLAFVILVICGYFATALAPRWAITNPEGLLLLNSRVRHLLLALGNDIPWWSYAGIAGARLALAFVVCHLIGVAYGNTVLTWFGRYLGSSRESIDQVLSGFDRAEWFVVPFFVGSNIVAAITGIRRTDPRKLALLVLIGLAARLAFYWLIAQIFDTQIDQVLDFLARYQRPSLIVSVVLVVVVVAFNLRRGRGFTYD